MRATLWTAAFIGAWTLALWLGHAWQAATR